MEGERSTGGYRKKRIRGGKERSGRQKELGRMCANV
jgi:hypothetical protein